MKWLWQGLLLAALVAGLAWAYRYRYAVGLIVKYPDEVDKFARAGNSISGLISQVTG